MNIFGIGLPEMAVIFVLALLIFGPKKLPEIGRSLGKAIRSFQDASNEFQSEFKREAEQLEKSIKEPMQATLEETPQPVLAPAAEATEATPEPANENADRETMVAHNPDNDAPR
jgi:sec-independent protein translocase protein TatA